MNLSPDRPVRLFAALDLPEQSRQVLASFQNTLRETVPLTATWPKSADIHLTLKFLGNVHSGRIDQIIRIMEKICREQGRGIDLWVSGAGLFFSAKQPTVIWAGVGGDTRRIERLHTRLDHGLETIGFARDRRRFRPHLTLARIKRMADKEKKRLRDMIKQFSETESDRFTINAIELYSSRLTSAGAIYTKIFSARFSQTSG